MSGIQTVATCIGCGRRLPFDKVPPHGWQLVNGLHGYCPKCQVRAGGAK